MQLVSFAAFDPECTEPPFDGYPYEKEHNYLYELQVTLRRL